VRALRAAIAAGVRVSIITGRLYSGTRAIAQRVGVEGAVGCADGSHLVCAADHTTLLHLGLRGNDVRLLRNALAGAGVTAFVFADDAIGHDTEGAPFLGYVSTWSTDIRMQPNVFDHELWSSPAGITAAIAVGPRHRIADAVRALERDLAAAAFFVMFPVRRGSPDEVWATLVRAAGGTKGTAIEWIARREGVPMADTVCVGDWLNDLPMFEMAGRSFAMGQAPDELKAKATDVLDETGEEGGGVARAVAKAFGITSA
jgi:hypothetical protein